MPTARDISSEPVVAEARLIPSARGYFGGFGWTPDDAREKCGRVLWELRTIAPAATRQCGAVRQSLPGVVAARVAGARRRRLPPSRFIFHRAA